MTTLQLNPAARGTLVESLYKLVEVNGLIITVQGSGTVQDLINAVGDTAPVLTQNYEMRANGLVVSQMPAYLILWGVVGSPAGSLAVLTPTSLFQGQDIRDWVRPFRVEVLDPIIAMSSHGYATGGGGNGEVTDSAFAAAFKSAYA